MSALFKKLWLFLMFSRSILKYVVSVGVLVFLLMQMDVSTLLEGVRHSSWWLLGISTLFIFGQIFFLNLRWHAYLNVGRKKVPFTASVLINLAGYFANILFITSVGGIIAKSGLAIQYGVSVACSFIATFLDRFMTLAALIVLGAIGMPFLQGTLDNTVLMMLALSIFFVILSVVLVVTLLRLGVFKDFILSDRKRSRGVATLRNFIENYDLMARTSAHSLLAQICFVLSVYTLSFGFEGTFVHAVEFLALIPVLALISSLPISFGGWGVREGAFIYGLGLLGFSMEDAFLLSVQVGLVTLVAPILVGLPYLIQNKFHILGRSCNEG